MFSVAKCVNETAIEASIEPAVSLGPNRGI